MKTGIKTITVMLLLSSMTLCVQAQRKHKETLVVTTRLKETNGIYAQRKLYCSFLKDFMKDCPHVSHVNVHETLCRIDNHMVIWTYEANSRKNITQFYNWVNQS